MASSAAAASNDGSAVAQRLAALEAVVKEMPASVPMDYHHECVPKGLLKYALADRGHKSGAFMCLCGRGWVFGARWLAGWLAAVRLCRTT